METSVNSASPLPPIKIVNNIQSTIKTKLSSLSDSFKCQLCGGYIINATTINECLHSFCRSCIVKHFNCNHDCPKCGLKFSETNKWETLRMDSMLQSLIYKLIPGLFRSEMKLRREFHSKSNDSPCDYFDEQKVYYQLDEKISVVLMYSKYSNDKSKKTIGSSKTSTSTSTSTSTTSSSSDEHRYLLCPAGFPIGSLKKFIYLKYELSSCFKVDIMFDDKILDDDLQLLDIVYIYSTQQPIPLHFKLNNFAVHKNNQTTTTSKSQINAIKKSMHNHQLASPSSTSLTSSSSSSSTKTSTSTSASSLNFHMKTTTATTSTASTNTPNNGNAKNDVKNDNTTLKSVAVQSSSVITCATSPMNPVSSSTSTVAPTRNSPSLSSQNIDKNQIERSQLMNEREKQAMHSVSSSIKASDTKRVIKPKVINTKLAPMVNQINLKRSTTSVLPCSTQVTTVTLNKQSKPSSVKTNKQSNMFVKSVELTNRETDKRFMNGYDNIGLTPISCSQSTPKVTSTNTVSSTPSVSITATTMITTTSHGAKNNFISKHLSQMNNESEKRKESDCKSDKSEAPRKQMKVSQVNDKINSQLSVTSSNQNDSSKSPSAPTSPKASSTQINTIDKAASNNVVNKITRDVNENCKTSHSVGTSISPNNSQTFVNTPKNVPSSVITNSVSAGNSNVTNSQSNNNKNNQSTNNEVKSNVIKVDDKVVKSSNANAIKAPSVSSSQASTVTSKSLSSSSSSSSPHLVIAPSPSPSTSSSSPSPKLLSTTSISSSKSSTISTSTSSSSSCTSTSTPTSTKVVSSSFYPTSTSTSTSTSISRLMNNQQQKLKQSGQGDKRQRESPSSSSPGNAPDNRPSKMVKISKNQTLNSQHKNLQIQQQQQQQQQQKQQHQQLQQQYKLHQQMIGNHDQLTNDSVFNVKALIADEKEAALNKNSPQTGFTLKSMPVDLRNPRNMNKSGGLHAIPSGPFQHFHHFANPSSVLVPIATGSSGHSPGPYHESSFPHLKYLEYTKLMGEALMQHFHQANNASFGVTLNLNGNVNGNVNGKSMNNIQGELVKGFYKETLTNSPNRENDTKNDK